MLLVHASRVMNVVIYFSDVVEVTMWDAFRLGNLKFCV